MTTPPTTRDIQAIRGALARWSSGFPMLIEEREALETTLPGLLDTFETLAADHEILTRALADATHRIAYLESSKAALARRAGRWGIR
jgi:hypothetical protein